MPGDSLTQPRLDQLRRRCEALLDESLTIDAFARDLVTATVEVMNVTAALIVEFQSAQELRVLAGQGLDRITVDGFFHLDPDHVSLLMQALRQQKLTVINDRAVPEAGLKRHSLLIVPIPANQPPVRVLELITLDVPVGERLAELKETAATLMGYFNRYLQEQSGQQTEATGADFWKQLDPFLLKLQQSLDLQRTIAVAVNDGRTLIGCDRVSIALRHGRRTRIYGVSGQEGVQRRANLVKAMAELATAVIKMGTTVTYRGTIEDLPLPIEEPLAAYLSESRTRMVQMIPLRTPAMLVTEEDDDRARRSEPPRKIIGCLLVEQATEARPKPQVVERTQLLVDHIETAIANCERYESIFLLPLWRALGRSIRWFRGRRLWTALAILLALSLLAGTLAWLPWEYRVEGTGQAMPVAQFEVFAPWEGDVKEILVDSGDIVQQGDVLLVLESDELEAERIAAEFEVHEKRKLVAALVQEEAEVQRGSRRDEIVKVAGELAKTKVELESGLAQLDKIKDRIAKLTVRAPANGVVATFQLRQLLQNRPVQRGEMLLEVMQPEGPWRLELEVPEYRMGHILNALRNSSDQTLPLEYVLATGVETTHRGIVTRLGNRSNQSEEEGTVFEVYADINAEDLPNRTIGADVIAKIDCGQRSLFYVLFGDVVEFLQRHLWF